MRWKRILAVMMAAGMTFSLAACGGGDSGKGGTEGGSEDTELLSYSEIELGKDYTDLEVTISLFNHRTDLESDDYGGVTWKEYLEEFNKMYPGITVDLTTDTNYADDALTHLQSGDYETVMMIPAVDKSDLSQYFMSFGSLSDMEQEINYANSWEYDGQVYGVPSTATAQGIVYNKKVFEEAGITELPKTPDEFIDALKAIKDNTDAIPLYTNYAAGWTMGAWDAYIGGNATGDAAYMNQTLLHTKDPFKDYGDGTHAYAVYKILYDATAEGLIEDDYTTTDWEGCKAMINNGEIGCMVLGSWAFAQMVEAGEHGDDIGYMPFPISVNGTQYALAGGDYAYAINANASDENKTAAMVFIKWMTEESGWCFNEGGYPVDKDGELPAMYSAFDGCTVLSDKVALPGEEDFLNQMNSESELSFNAGGDAKVQRIVESAFTGAETFDDIMADWTTAWNDAQEALGIEVAE